MKRDELIRRLPHSELLKSLYISQFIFLGMSLALSVFLFNHFSDWKQFFVFDVKQIFYYGVIPGILIVIVNIALMLTVPERLLDDGGINDKIFKNSSIGQIFLIALVVSLCEELLFRGLIQTVFGYVFASSFFAFVHIRYLKKPILLMSIILVSFYFGFLFKSTDNLLTTMTAHFLVDFLLGLIIRFKGEVF